MELAMSHDTVKVAKGQHVEGTQQKSKDRTWEDIPFQRLGRVCYGACKERTQSEKVKQGRAFPQKPGQKTGFVKKVLST